MNLTIAIKKAKFKNRTVSLKEIPVPTSFFYNVYKKKGSTTNNTGNRSLLKKALVKTKRLTTSYLLLFNQKKQIK